MARFRRDDIAFALTALWAISLVAALLIFDRQCVTVTFVSSNEKSGLLTQIANDWGRTAYVDGRCARISLVRKPSGDTEEALARGWDERVDGSPPPDVWSPAASSWTLLLRQHRSDRGASEIVPLLPPSIMQSPLVIAMPRTMAEAYGWPQRQIGWAELVAFAADPVGWARYGHPEWGRFRLGKTDPRVSTSGLHALVAAFFAATGRLPAETDVKDLKVRDFVRGVEQSVVHYSETVATFLTNLRDADRRDASLGYVSAVAIEEKQVWDYNRGVIVGDATESRAGLPPKVPLVAFYPKDGTLVADHPYVVLDAPWVTDEKRSVAREFLRHLQGAVVQQRFASEAFRDHLGHAGTLIAAAPGLLAAEPSLILRPPAPRVLEQIQSSWSELRKRARVILAIDVSETMGAVAASNQTKLDLVKRAAIGALDRLEADDEIGLWIFSTRLPGGGSYRELIPVSRIGQRKADLSAAIEQLVPVSGGRTPLYATARAGVQVLRGSIDPTRVNAVVLLTDGHNEDPADDDRTRLLAELQSQREDELVRVFTIGYGAEADAETLRLIAQASRGIYVEAAPGAIDRVLRGVIASF